MNIKEYLLVGAVVVAAMIILSPAMAEAAPLLQNAIPTLAVDSNAIQVGLFGGANVILLALGGIFFLLIGFGFGGKILRAIGDFIQRFSF